jgi:site-specific recombinase XerD
MRVSEVRTSHLNEWLALHEKRLKHTSYNRYAGFLKQLFAIAVDDRIIAEAPVAKLKTPWKRPQTPQRHVPTIPQFEAIVAHITATRRCPNLNGSIAPSTSIRAASSVES